MTAALGVPGDLVGEAIGKGKSPRKPKAKDGSKAKLKGETDVKEEVKPESRASAKRKRQMKEEGSGSDQ